MRGVKLMAVKLGLLALAARLQIADRLCVSSFNQRLETLTPGYITATSCAKVYILHITTHSCV